MSIHINPKRALLATGAAIGALAVPATALAAEPTVNWQINLSPASAYPKAVGGAQYQSQPGQREIQVEVEHITALKGQHVTVCANGQRLGTVTVSRLGIAQIERNTELGQAVPVITHGSTVSVATGATCAGAPIAHGTF